MRVCASSFAAFFACLLAGLAHAAAQETNATTATSALYIRSDSDQTTVVTPRIHLGAPLAEATRLDLVYTVDVWSSASIDIRTAASKRVTEQRDEIDVSVEHAMQDTTLGASYRYSTETDYESNGGSLSMAFDLANKSATLALTGAAYFDRVGMAGDPDFDRAASTMTASAAFSQVIDPESIVRVVYELTRQQGYLSSPYRYVRIAANADALQSTCRYPVQMCIREDNPDSRLRHAIAINGRRALSKSLSAGLKYRFYIDDWKMSSHTLGVDGAWAPDNAWLFALGYRYYNQGKAEHYQPFYLSMPMPAHPTSDKELSTLSTHRLEFELSRTFELDDLGTELRSVLRAAPSYFQYDDFLLLDSITAIDVTLSVEVRL